MFRDEAVPHFQSFLTGSGTLATLCVISACKAVVNENHSNMENLSCVTVKRKSSSDVKWVTLKWLVADWRPPYALWESNCSSACFSLSSSSSKISSLRKEENKSVLFTFQTPVRMSVNLTFINFERQASSQRVALPPWSIWADSGHRVLANPRLLVLSVGAVGLGLGLSMLILVLSSFALFKSCLWH